MFAEERQKNISLILNNNGSIKVNELSEYFNVSEATIRRDLQEMEEKKLLKRTHGGAVRVDITNFEPSFLDKKDERQDEKLAIAKAAASMIKDGDTIILDSGTTTLQIAKNITARNVTVITNSIDIAEELSNNKDLEIVVTGGTLRFKTRAMVGHICEKTFSYFRVDKAFMGANGISSVEGITTPNFTEAQTKKAMINAANKVIVVADSSKIQNVCLSVICPISDVTSIITSGSIPQEIESEFRDKGIDVIISK
ncbi:DeoR/GlpR family DNA-binding transcription regulator [Clostridium hydrogenum]|uniref:DeoR/GlpR family DNA-binding transcription regulator n=1 Tax=Clostridium hydrogenum TaxID=2855764 RepID=UPI001F2AB3CF|nr:DeoR/GlpR family DNA-binding transcription regulator [Clostridium hydrogenum]